MSFDIHIIGGGLAGSEAAWQLAEAGLRVRLSEMRGGGNTTPAMRPMGLPRWCVRTASGRTTPSTMPSACCMKRCARWIR